MIMDERFGKLYELHMVDDRFHAAQRAMAALDQPPPVAEQHQRIVAELARQEPLLARLRDALQSEEAELKALEKKQKADTKKLYGGEIVATRELQGLQHELETLAVAISAHEEKVLAWMEKVDPVQAGVETLKQYQAAAERKLAEHHKSCLSERRRLRADLAAAEPLRAPAAAAVEEELLKLYELIRRQKGHPGMAVVRDGGCGQCHTSVPGMVMRRLREGSEAVQCDNCSRIYYLPERVVT